MTEIIGFESPLTKMQREYEEKLAAKNKDIEMFKLLYEQAKVDYNRVRGVNEMLKLQLLDLCEVLKTVSSQILLVQDNVDRLKEKLPEELP